MKPFWGGSTCLPVLLFHCIVILVSTEIYRANVIPVLIDPIKIYVNLKCNLKIF
jgi:hypothetical protein